MIYICRLLVPGLVLFIVFTIPVGLEMFMVILLIRNVTPFDKKPEPVNPDDEVPPCEFMTVIWHFEKVFVLHSLDILNREIFWELQRILSYRFETLLCYLQFGTGIS